MGVVAGMVNKANQSAKEIIDEIVSEAAEILGGAGQYVGSRSMIVLRRVQRQSGSINRA